MRREASRGASRHSSARSEYYHTMPIYIFYSPQTDNRRLFAADHSEINKNRPSRGAYMYIACIACGAAEHRLTERRVDSQPSLSQNSSEVTSVPTSPSVSYVVICIR